MISNFLEFLKFCEMFLKGVLLLSIAIVLTFGREYFLANLTFGFKRHFFKNSSPLHFSKNTILKPFIIK